MQCSAVCRSWFLCFEYAGSQVARPPSLTLPLKWLTRRNRSHRDTKRADPAVACDFLRQLGARYALPDCIQYNFVHVKISCVVAGVSVFEHPYKYTEHCIINPQYSFSWPAQLHACFQRAFCTNSGMYVQMR